MPEPTTTPAVNPPPTSAATSFADLLARTFGEGNVIPVDPEPVKPTQPQPIEGATAAAPAPGATAAAPPATGATGPAPEAATGPTGATGATAAATGATAAATGATAAATGATGPAPEAATGATGPTLTQEQLDAASKKMDVKAGTAFKYVRGQLETTQTELNSSRTKIAELEAKLKEAPTADPKVVADLQEKVADYERKLAAYDYQTTPEYQSKIESPLTAAEATLKSIASKYNVDQAELRAAIGEKDAAKRSDQLSELSKDFNRLDMATFDRNIAAYDNLQAEKAKVLQFAAETMEKQRRDAEAARAAQVRDFQQSWNASLDTTLKTLAEKNPIFAKTGDEKWDADLAGRISKIKSVDIARVPNEALASALYKEAAFDLMEGLVADLVHENQTLNDRVTKLQGGTPPAGAGQVPTEVAVPTVKPDASFLQTIKDKLPGILPA
jgi:hypothetical protein